MSKSSSTAGITFPGLLAILFITLKLCNVITWSWWWVLAPVWIGIAIGFIALAIKLIVLIINETRL